MPIYKYKCSMCGHVFEETNTVALRRLMLCPKCKGDATLQWSTPAEPVMNPSCPVKARRGGGGYV